MGFKFWKAAAVVFISLLALDAIWLTFRLQYHKTLFYAVQKAPLSVRWIPAIVVYLLLTYAIVKVALKGGKRDNIHKAAGIGAVVGGVMYGFYDATNYATLKGWTAEMAITDTMWGTVASAIAAGMGAWFAYKK
jgi:uncharacterized membrane protein